MSKAGHVIALLKGTVRFVLPLFVLLVSGCGYSLEIAKLEEQKVDDPITLIRRDIRQVKANHRVALFDLRKDQNEQLRQFRSELEGMGAVRQDIAQLNQKLQEAQLSLRRKDADIDERISEMEVQQRLIQGVIEEESNHLKEISAEASQFTLKELERLKGDLSTQDLDRKKLEKSAKEWVDSAQKKLLNQLTALKEKEKYAQSTLEGQIDFLKANTHELGKSLTGQSQAIKGLSEQFSQILEKLLPAVNKLGERMDTLEWRLKKLDSDIDLDALNRRLAALGDAVDVQRQSLEMLGNTLAPQVDEQRALIRQTIDRLKEIEATKPSSVP